LPGTAHRGSLECGMASAKDDGSLQDHEGHAGTIVMSNDDEEGTAGTVVMSDHHEGHAGTVVMGHEPDPKEPIDPRLARMRAIQQAGDGRAVKPRPAPAAAPGTPAARTPGKVVFGGAAADDNPSPPSPTSDVDPMGGTVAMVDDHHPMSGTVALMDDNPMGGTLAVMDASEPLYPVPPPPPPPGAQPPGPALPYGAPPSVVQPPPAKRMSPIVIGLLVVCGLLAVGAALFHFMRS
jgi:hypothetical protein